METKPEGREKKKACTGQRESECRNRATSLSGNSARRLATSQLTGERIFETTRTRYTKLSVLGMENTICVDPLQ